MIRWILRRAISPCVLGLVLIPVWTANPTLADEPKAGKVGLQSVGPITFGPEGVLLWAIPKGPKSLP